MLKNNRIYLFFSINFIYSDTEIIVKPSDLLVVPEEKKIKH